MTGITGMTGKWLARAAVEVLRRPALWGVAIAQLVRLAPRGWWRRWPPLPSPDPSYLRFRLQTQYGDAAREPEPADVVAYLQWCRRYGRVTE